MSQLTKFLGPKALSATLAVIAVIAISAFGFFHYSSQKSKSTPANQKANSADSLVPSKTKSAAINVSALPEAKVSADTLLPLGTTLGSYVDKHAPGSSVYIESLDKHIAVHVGETTAYNTKSLMKVPLVMGLYKASSLGRLNLDQPVTISAKHIDQSFGSLWQKKAGHQLTLRQAAQFALKSSDNTAIRLINEHVFAVMPANERAYKVIGLDYRIGDNGDTYITTSSYAKVFRCLYESCYNTKADSEEMLNLMKQSDFTTPKKALPDGVEVAHKIGNVGPKGYNDCGIVYGAKEPYMFCAMLAVGMPQAEEDISWITKQAYDFFEK
jgi:beta-lactamase class A